MKKSLNATRMLSLLFLMAIAGHAFAQKERYNVAIFLYNGVELLDFAGPGEVFSAAGFNVYTVTLDGGNVLSQGFVTIKAQYSMDTAPDPDIVVFPGGGSGPTSKNQKVLDWINARVRAGAVGMSVCTGASILANAGLLKGLNVTTWHGFIPRLQADHPDVKVLDNTRFVDSGNIITTAGVSAGIDGALHMVARIKGLDEANATARYMEYDKWRPDEGRVDITNAYLDQLTGQVTQLVKEEKVSMPDNVRKPYLGEMKNLASELKEKGKYKEEAAVLEAAIKIYPNSAWCYNQLGDTYRKLGKSAPAGEDAYLSLLEVGKIDEMRTLYEKDKKQFAAWKLVDERRVNLLGYKFLQEKNHDLAIRIFELNTKLFPTSGNAFDSLAEGYLTAGNRKDAVVNYKKSLELDPANENARKILARIEGGEL
ncbi:MAG TPA: DJ-1/PfpI family protein [Cyclobacteriaceae bacterium]|nr:DJ-1/PfpI family protein [Cyclobacteriaceae bacterium]